MQELDVKISAKKIIDKENGIIQTIDNMPTFEDPILGKNGSNRRIRRRPT